MYLSIRCRRQLGKPPRSYHNNTGTSNLACYCKSYKGEDPADRVLALNPTSILSDLPSLRATLESVG